MSRSGGTIRVAGGVVRVALFLLLAAGARAGDGRIEINQAAALAGSVMAGDAPGFPVTLTTSGSYVLTSDLDLGTASGAENLTAIDFDAPNIDLDLNGFTIRGPNFCFGSTTLTCSRLGTGRGVDGRTLGGSVRNGSIIGVGGIGIELTSERGNFVEDVALSSCGGGGIVAGGRSVVRANHLAWNVGIGISVGSGSTIERNNVTHSGSHGIQGTFGLLIQENLVSENVGDGIVLTSSGGLVRNNVVEINLGAGLRIVSSTSFVGNTLRSNTGGNLPVAPVSLGPNLCGTVVCP